jgi:hypothetical protein
VPKVDITDDNIRHCRCPVCPVQTGSDCAKKNLNKINNSSTAGEFDIDNASILYCSIGKSSCTDLDANQNCYCPTCLVWNDYDLSQYKYCLRGDAEDIG